MYEDRIAKAQKTANAILDEAELGEKFCFEGTCPSGATYDGFFVWDGTESCRTKAMTLVAERSLPNAWAGKLVTVMSVRHGLAVAEMRTGRA